MTDSLEIETAAREFYHQLDVFESQNWHDPEEDRIFKVNLFVMALEKGRIIERVLAVKRKER
jgi:hypothetical protein